jgi:rhamnogalacturonan endolyase
VEPRQIDWQTDAKHYEFWTRGEDNGSFRIPNVRPGKYTLHAIADGVLGEYLKTDLTIEPGKALTMGNLEWVPVRHGKQLWEIGIPNRTGSEFAKGDDYAHDGMFLLYAKLFPTDGGRCHLRGEAQWPNPCMKVWWISLDGRLGIE